MGVVNVQHEIILAGPIQVLKSKTILDFLGGLSGRAVAPTFGALIALDLSLGCWFDVTAAAATNITLSNPTNVPVVSGQLLGVTIYNTSGGAMGTVSFGTQLKTAGAFTTPATANNRSIVFRNNAAPGTTPNWIEIWRGAADVAN